MSLGFRKEEDGLGEGRNLGGRLLVALSDWLAG